MSGSENNEGKSHTNISAEYLDPGVARHQSKRRREHAIYPGIYFTPGISDVNSEPAHASNEVDVETARYTDIALMGRDELIREERELAKSIAKLKSSNEEIIEFDPDGKDPDLVDARKENEGAISRGMERIELMRNRLEILERIAHCSSG